jgi:glycosyltransferase involved in cell wall biosynthesis
MTHVCQCYKDYSLVEGGVERVMQYISQVLCKDGYKVTAVVSRRPGSAERDNVYGVEEVRVKPAFYTFKVPIMPGYYNCLKSLAPDILHVHGTIPNISDVVVSYANKHRVPSIFHYHFDGNAESAIGNIAAGIYNSTINSYAVKNATKVVTLTKIYAEMSPVLRPYLKKVEVIPNGVDIKKFNPEIDVTGLKAKYNIPDGKIIFSAVRLVKYKGMDYLIRAMKGIKNATLVIAGVGPEEAALKKLADDLKIDNIKFLGLIHNENMAQFYRISDVYAIPSVTTGEHFGISALEAMACGIPIVATNLPGHREFITQDFGILVEPRKPEELTTSICSILADDKMHKEMAIAARKNAEKYSWDIITQRWLEIYRDLLR